MAIACVVWFGGNQVIAQLRDPGRAGGVHAICAALLPPHPGPEREVQHPAGGDGVERARLQAARHASRRSSRPPTPKVPQGAGRIEFDHVWFAYRTLAQAAEEAASKGEKLKVPWLPANAAELRVRLGAARRIVHHRAGCDGRDRRTHRRRQDHDHLAAAALLRCAEGRHPHRRRRHSRHGPERPAAALRRGAAGSVPVLGNGGRQHSAGLALDSGRGGGRGGRAGQRRRLHSLAARRI